MGLLFSSSFSFFLCIEEMKINYFISEGSGAVFMLLPIWMWSSLWEMGRDEPVCGNV